MVPRTGYLAAALIATALASAMGSAAACRGPLYETRTLLRKLPAGADQEEIVAKVQILELVEPRHLPSPPLWTFTGRAKVRVIEEIKGVRKDDVIAMDTGGSSCDQLFSKHSSIGSHKYSSIGSQGYIAGQWKLIGGDTVFVGRWRTDLITGEYIH